MSTTIAAKPLIHAKYASNSGSIEYSAPSSTNTIVDKFTAYNSSGGPVDLSIYIMRNGASPSNANIVTKQTVATLTTLDLTEIQNHVLGPTDSIHVLASAGSAISIRASGREVTT